MNSHAPRLALAPLATTSGANGRDWRPWTRSLGREVRRLRRDLELSQEELAALSGVSQGAVSRLETGRALKTPLLAVVRVYLALLIASRQRHRALLKPDVTAVLDRIAGFGSAPDTVGDSADLPEPDESFEP